MIERKRKSSGSIASMREIAALVVWKLFIKLSYYSNVAHERNSIYKPKY